MIRLATQKDAESIVRVNISSWQAGYKKLLPTHLLSGISIKQRLKKWQQAFYRDGFTVLVKEVDHKIVDYCAFGPYRQESTSTANDAGEIYSLYLHPKQWRQGFGYDLLTRSCSNLNLKGYQTTLIWVMENNQQAIRLYQKFGFEGTQKSKQMELFQLEEKRMVRGGCLQQD